MKLDLSRFNGKTAQSALEIGKAAEHLVVADLILNGYKAFLSDQGTSYDIVMDHKNRLYRVQVKATLFPKKLSQRPGSFPSYKYNVKRAGKGAKRIIGINEFDILALVALDIRCIAYLKMSDKVLQCMNFRVPDAPKTHGNKLWGNIDDYPIHDLIKEEFSFEERIS